MAVPRRDLSALLHTTSIGQALLVEAPQFLADAICPTVDPAVFFPERGGSARNAKKVCAHCPVTGDCLEYALALEGIDRGHGVYGGLSPIERQKIARARHLQEAS